MKNKTCSIELLAPARDAMVACEAIDHGADAVYIGPDHFGARAMAGNAVDDIARVCDYAHKFRAKVYATVNTIVFDDELRNVEKLIKDLYKAQVDALIVQDLGVLRLDIPPIALHASTQCDIRTPEKARFLQDLGFSQLVLARELSLPEIEDVRRVVDVPLEAFVHGALCVSYSGRCALSHALKGRSANRGQCAQLCRLPYDLEDGKGNKIVSGKHLLSLRDLNQADRLRQLVDAGISSFKIEGRLKDVSYVKNVVAHYSSLLNDIVKDSDGKLVRQSCGDVELSFTPDVQRSFNRSFTHYFLDGRETAKQMACLDSPKSQGQPLGKVLSSHGKSLSIATRLPLANGDGLSYYDDNREFCGVRVNVANGNNLTLRDSVHIKPGTMVYRTADKAFDDIMARPSATRHIAIDARLRRVGDDVVLSLNDNRGNAVSHSMRIDNLDQARSPQHARQQDVISKLGGTVYKLRSFETSMGDVFVPVSLLAQLRRDAIQLLDRSNALTHQRELRRREAPEAQAPYKNLTHADNVANHLARELYADHGVVSIQPAIETAGECSKAVLMHTRYCIRRELGACRKVKNAKQLPDQLFLRCGNNLLGVHCNCSTCEMKITLG